MHILQTLKYDNKTVNRLLFLCTGYFYRITWDSPLRKIGLSKYSVSIDGDKH